jgi:hypothetical protein
VTVNVTITSLNVTFPRRALDNSVFRSGGASDESG